MKGQLLVTRFMLGSGQKTPALRTLKTSGKLTHCELKEGMHLYYGFIEFEDRKDAEKAIRLENAETS